MSNPCSLFDAPGSRRSRTPAKSIFAETCSLLREYVKEKGPLRGDLSFGLAFPLDRKVDVKPEPVKQTSAKPVEQPQRLESMNLYSWRAGQDCSIEEPAKKESEKRALQMTIFYGGQVMVLNIPSNKAEEVMRLASKASSKVPALAHADPSATAVPPLVSTARPSSHTTSPDASFSHVTRLPHQHIVTDLPIKRKASLSRFLEKRKSRINARAPYNINLHEPLKPADNKLWLELGPGSLI